MHLTTHVLIPIPFGNLSADRILDAISIVRLVIILMDVLIASTLPHLPTRL